MAEEDRHIEQISLSLDDFWANGDHGQSNISDDDEFMWLGVGGSRLYVAAHQYWYDGSNHYIDNAFNSVRVHGDVIIPQYIRKFDAVGNNVSIESTQIKFNPNSVEAFVLTDEDIYTPFRFFSLGREDFEDWVSDVTAFQLGDQGSLVSALDDEILDTDTYIMSNVYIGTGTLFHYIADGYSNQFVQEQLFGNFSIYGDPSGSAGDTFTRTKNMFVEGNGSVHLPRMKSGGDQGDAGAEAGEWWINEGDDNTVNIGT